MPVFRLNKLVRDGLRTEYDRMGQVAVYRTLTQLEHVRELQHKIKEEAGEIPLNGPHDEVVSELADVQQRTDASDTHQCTTAQPERVYCRE